MVFPTTVSTTYMKNRLLQLIIKSIFLTLAFALMIPPSINVNAEQELKKIDFNISASKNVTTIDQDESITYMIDGFSYDFTGTDTKIGSDFQFEILTERYSEALEIENIEIPPLIDSDTGEIEVGLYGWDDVGVFHKIATKIITTSSGQTEFTREEIEQFKEVNDGKLPIAYILFINNVSDPITHRTEPSQKLIFDEPIKFNYKVSDKVSFIQKPNSENIAIPRPNHFFQVESSYYIGSDVNNKYEDLKTIYSYILSSTVEFKTEDFILIEDDHEVKFDFKVENHSTINPNRLLYIGFELDD